MKKSILFGLMVCLCLALPIFALAGEAAASLTLATAEDLVAFRNSLAQKDYTGETVVLAQSITYPAGTAPLSSAPLPFQGTFDGQGNMISGFSDNQYGFIGNLGANGTVQRLHVNIDAENIAVANYGAIANECAGLITECYVSGLMEGGNQPGTVNIGGIAGILQDDDQNQRARIDNCLMAARILPAEGEQVALVSAYGIANCTDNKRIYACLVSGELDGDSVYGISARGANHQPGEGSYYDNTVSSASAEDQYSTAKTFDELLGTNLYAMDGWDREKWLMEANELPKVACFYAAAETVADTGAETEAPQKAPTQQVRVTGVKLNHSTASVRTGETLQLKATVSPRNATQQRVTWSTADEKIATVSSKGAVTGKAIGTTTITVKTYDGWHTATCTVTVGQGLTLSLSATTLQMALGQPATLTATLSGGDTTGARITWTNSDTSVVTFVADGSTFSGTLTPQKQGTATVTATVTGTGISASCTVNVADASAIIAADAVTLSQAAASLQPGSTVKLTATVFPENASNKAISWSTSDGAVASVSSDGTVTANAAGTATITASTHNGLSAVCIITVAAAAPTEAPAPEPTQAPAPATEEPAPAPTVEPAPVPTAEPAAETP